MKTLVRDIKKGDVFTYVQDCDVLGQPINSEPVCALADAVLEGKVVFIAYRNFNSRLIFNANSTVEKIDGPE